MIQKPRDDLIIAGRRQRDHHVHQAAVDILFSLLENDPLALDELYLDNSVSRKAPIRLLGMTDQGKIEDGLLARDKIETVRADIDQICSGRFFEGLADEVR